MELPRVCDCGELIRYSNEECCEDCFAMKADTLHGISQRVKSLPWLEPEDEDQTRRRSGLFGDRKV